MKKNYYAGAVLGLLLTGVVTLAAADAQAAIEVNVMPSGVSSKINSWDSGPYTWPGNTLELWGNVADTSTAAKTYTWHFGDGTPDVSGSVTNVNNIAFNHIYTSTGSYAASLTVTNNTTLESDTDTVYIDVVPNPALSSDAVKVNLTVQRALKYLYMTKTPWTINGCTDAYYWSQTDHTGDTGLAVLAFEDHGHREMNPHGQDIYAETVQGGLKGVFSMLRSQAASNIVNVDSDLNGNGLKVYDTYTNNMYRQGILTMAIANTATPTATATCGYNATITGQTYQTLVEDMVDQIAYAQEDRTGCYGYGGWRYTPNYCSTDNSVSQWPVLGLAAAAGAPFNVTAPAWVKTLLASWSAKSQYTNGGFGYDSASNWVNIAKTGSGIIGMTYAGGGGNLTNAVNYIGVNWGTTSYDYGNIGDHYAMYAVKKGLQYAGLSTVGGHDWQKEYNTWYVDHRVDNSTNGYYWPGSVRINAGRTTAAFAALVMAPGLVELPPVADAGGDQDVVFLQNVSFDGSGSHHTDPARHIVTYQWDYDYDGLTFDADGSGVAPTKVGGYSLPAGVSEKNFTVALRVTDDSSPVRQATDTAIVTVSNGNVAPVANPGGPYSGPVGSTITLDASASSDANSVGGTNPICGQATPSGCDEIVSYQWDLDGDGLYGTVDGEPEGVTALVSFGPFVGTKTLGLKVTDSFGRSAAQSAQLTTAALTDVFPVSYQLISNVYDRRTGKYAVSWKVNIKNAGNSDATNVTAKLTGNTIPSGMTVTDNNVKWTVPDNVIGAAEVQLSDDVFSYTYSRSAGGPNLSQVTWDIEYDDALGHHFIVRNIPQ